MSHAATALDRYARALPESEHRALTSWASTFYPFQAAWLFDVASKAVSVKSRQIGLSHTTSAMGVLWGAFHGELTTIVSIGELESREVLEKSKRHAWVLTQLGSRMARVKASSASEIKFASGGRILALPSTAGRGFTGNAFLDEYAYQERAAEVWEAVAAVTMLGGRLRVASTPNGVGNEFHKLWSKDASLGGWSRHEIPIERAQADGYPVDIANCWTLARHDPRLFDQLFRCKFLDGEAQYIPTALLERATTDDLYTWDAGEYYAGLDIGRTADLTVLVVVWRGPDGVRKVVYLESCKRTDDAALQSLVSRAFSLYRLRRLCVDASGMGAFPADEMQRRHGRARVEPVTFTAQVKEDLATSLYQAFAAETVKLPRDDATIPGLAPGEAAQLRQDICAIRRVVTSAGNVRYDAPHTDEGHADRAWALALALHGCNDAPNVRHVAAGR